MTLMLAVTLLVGCSKTEVNQLVQDDTREKKLQVITTVFAPYDFTRQIVGDQAEITMLVPPAAESHSYEPTPQDIIKIQNCDVFIYGGGESDEWVTDILESIGNEDIKIIKMLDSVELVEEELVEGMQDTDHDHDIEEGHAKEHEETHTEEHEDEHAHEAEEIEYDEHVWTSPKNAMLITETIKEVLISVDEDHKVLYENNASAYIEELKALDAAFPGCSTDTEPSAATVAFLIDKVREDEVPVVFHIELSNEKMADTICEATGAKKLLFNACHTISKADFESGVTYLEIMKQNVVSLKEALS